MTGGCVDLQERIADVEVQPEPAGPAAQSAAVWSPTNTYRSW